MPRGPRRFGFREALAAAAHSNIDDRQLVVLHDALAGAYAEAEQFAEAEGEYRRVLALVEKAEGQGSRNYALLLGQMAILPTQTGNRDDVIALLRQAIAVNARIGSIKNITVIRECLAQILRGEKRYQEEEPLLEDALADLVRQKAADPALMGAALNNLAVLRFDQERYQESVDLQLESIRVWETASGKEHPSLVAPLNDLATAYLKVARFDDADLTYERAINICRKTLGENTSNMPSFSKTIRLLCESSVTNAKPRKSKPRGKRFSEQSTAATELARRSV